MKLLNTIILIIILLISINGQDKPEANKVFIVLGGGTAIPSSSGYLTDNWNLGYNATLGIEGSISELFTYTVAQVQFSQLFLDKKSYLHNFFPNISNAKIEGRNASMLGVWSNLKFKFFDRPKKVFPLLWFGLGFMELIRKEATISNADTTLTVEKGSDGYLSLTIGLGVQYNLSETVSVNINSSYIGCAGFLTPQYLDNISYYTVNLGVLVSLGKTCPLPTFPTF